MLRKVHSCRLEALGIKWAERNSRQNWDDWSSWQRRQKGESLVRGRKNRPAPDFSTSISLNVYGAFAELPVGTNSSWLHKWLNSNLPMSHESGGPSITFLCVLICAFPPQIWLSVLWILYFNLTGDIIDTPTVWYHNKPCSQFFFS